MVCPRSVQREERDIVPAEIIMDLSRVDYARLIAIVDAADDSRFIAYNIGATLTTFY
jgi:hypothetical protein